MNDKYYNPFITEAVQNVHKAVAGANQHVGELTALQKENSDLKYEVTRLQKELAETQALFDKEMKDHWHKHRIALRLKRQLEIAVDALKYANKCIKGGCVNWETEIDKALDKITALEQKDNQ